MFWEGLIPNWFLAAHWYWKLLKSTIVKDHSPSFCNMKNLLELNTSKLVCNMSRSWPTGTVILNTSWNASQWKDRKTGMNERCLTTQRWLKGPHVIQKERKGNYRKPKFKFVNVLPHCWVEGVKQQVSVEHWYWILLGMLLIRYLWACFQSSLPPNSRIQQFYNG